MIIVVRPLFFASISASERAASAAECQAV